LARKETLVAEGKMHADEVHTDASLVGRLLAAQFPRWADLPIRPFPSAGTVNAMYRLGDDMIVRLARIGRYIEHAEKEHRIIAMAAADELTVAHPDNPGTPASVALILGGTALFLAGHALFERAVFGVLPWSRVIAIVVLAVLVPAGLVLPAIMLSGAAGLIMVGVAVWDTLAYGGYVRSPRRSIP